MIKCQVFPKSIKYINTALELDDKNPKVWMEKGNLTYYIPVFLGGGLDKAIKCHEKAVELFEKNPDNLEYNWVYLLVMTNLGRWYTEDGEIKKARELYKKILNFEFNYLWVRDELYPDVL